MDPKSTPEQSVISDERASLQRAVILSCWKLTIIGRLGPQKLRLGPEKLPVGPCPFRSGDFSAPSRDFSAPSGDFVSPTRRFQKATRADTGATRTHRGRLAGPNRRTGARPTRSAESGSTGGRHSPAGRVGTRCGEAPLPLRRGARARSHSAARVGARHYRHYLWQCSGAPSYPAIMPAIAYSLDIELDILQCSVDTAG